MMQPSMMNFLIRFLSCREIGGNRYILADITLECYTEEHMKYAFTIALPLLFLWAAFMQVVIFFYLKKQNSNKKIKNIKNSLICGYIYDCYTVNNYFWDILRAFMKLSLILSYSYLYQVFILSNSISLLILIIYLIAILIR